MKRRQNKRSQLDLELEQSRVDAFNRKHNVGTPVKYWSGVKSGEGVASRTRSAAWPLDCGTAVVMVEGKSGGIALTSIEVTG